MRLPTTPPPFPALHVPDKLADVSVLVDRVVSQGDAWWHWDDLRRRPVPEGLTHEAWWVVLKLLRTGQLRRLPWADAAGRPFQVAVPDRAQELLRLVDSKLSGSVGLSENLLGPHDRERYLLGSLHEEAIRSSLLEGAATTRLRAKELLRSGRAPRGVAEQMVVNTLRSLEAVRAWRAEAVTVEAILEVHRIVTTQTLDDDSAVGRLRHADEDVRVRGDEDQILHTPPPASELAAGMADLVRFANGEETGRGYVHPVVRAIVCHFWLAWLHPFVDGNGRTARALFYWVMLRNGYWLVEYLPISRSLHEAPAQYARAFLLTETDDNDVTYFLLHQLNVLRLTLEGFETHVARKVQALRETERLLPRKGLFNSRQLALVQHALRHPGTAYTIASHQGSHGVSYPTARADLLDLEARGVLQGTKRGKAFEYEALADLSDRLRKLAERSEG